MGSVRVFGGGSGSAFLSEVVCCSLQSEPRG